MGVVSKDFKGFLFVMYFCQVFVVLAGCGWVWLVVDGCGWVWLGALFRTAQFRLVNFLENGRDYILKENKGFYITKNENYTLKSTKYQAHNFISTYFSFFGVV